MTILGDQLSSQECGNTQGDAIAVTTERMCDLLLSFPSSAIGGVPWQTLVQKYEERYATRLDPTVTGHESTVEMATSLLSGVLRFVDVSEAENPIVAAQDAVVMIPHPGALGSWPSLYQALCNAVMNHGSPEKEPSQNEAPFGLLLSQLKPLLRVHWHPGFEERCLGCLSDDGKFLRLWKLKHLVQAVIRWRELRMMWHAASGCPPSLVDEALIPTLELVQSKQHSDLVLRCMPNGVVLQELPGSIVSKGGVGLHPLPELACEMRSFSRNQASRKVQNSAKWSAKPLLVKPELLCASGNTSPTEQDEKQYAMKVDGTMAPKRSAYDLEEEAAKLRLENEELRSKNQVLEHRFELLQKSRKVTQEAKTPLQTPSVELPPFVTVPEDTTESSSLSPSSVTSTRASEHLSVDFQITDETMSIGDEDDVQSRAFKHVMSSSLLSKIECIDPKVSKRWAKHIPKGIVQQARARFEFKNDDAYTEEILGFAAKGA